MTIVGRVGEGLARRTNRRETVTRTAATIFGLAAAWAAQGPFGSAALAGACAERSGYPYCQPPGEAYCTNPDWGGRASYCDGARCSGPCTLDTAYYPREVQAGCWCTQIRRKGQHRFYYKCCDCRCPGFQNPAATNPNYPYPVEAEECGCRKRITVQ